MVAQFGNSEDVRKKHYKNASITIEDAKGFGVLSNSENKINARPTEQSFLKFLQFSETFFRLFLFCFLAFR